MTTVYAVETEDLQYEDIHSITNWTDYGFHTRKKVMKYYLPPPHDDFFISDAEVLKVIQPEYITREKFLLLKLLGEIQRNKY